MELKSLALGFVLGILFVFFCMMITITMANRRFLKKTMASPVIDNRDVKSMISAKNKQILKSAKLGINNNISLIQKLSKELILEIARYYYPESKYPLFEVTLVEAIDMNERVSERIKKLLDTKVFGLFKQVRLSQILYILEVKRNFGNTKIMAFSKKYHLSRVLNYGYAALNFANPGYWLRWFIYTSTLESTLRGIAVMSMNIIGQEAKTLYSKKIEADSDKILEKELTQFIREIEASEN